MSYTYERRKGTTEKSKAFVHEMKLNINMKLKKGEVFRYHGELVKIESMASIECLNGVIVVRGKCKSLPRKEPS